MISRTAAWFLGISFCTHLSSAAGHDFWLQPAEFEVAAEAATAMTLQVGHGPFRQRSPIPAKRITRFEVISPSGNATDLRPHLDLGQTQADGHFTLRERGAHVLVLQTDNRAQTHLPAIRFNDYLNAEGLTPALEQRSRLHHSDTDGSERYGRCAKSFVLAGNPDGESQTQISKPMGLELEIVPEVSPYDKPQPAGLPVRVFYEGHLLAGALVKLTNLHDDASPLEIHVTDQEGRATFQMPHSGAWLLNVIWTKPLPASEDLDFETVFSSLSFGFPEPSS